MEDDFPNLDEMTPFPRREKLPPEGKAMRFIREIDAHIAKIAKLGLRPHPLVLDNRRHCVEFLEGKAERLEMERFQRGGWF
jgi:hypothetical protein